MELKFFGVQNRLCKVQMDQPGFLVTHRHGRIFVVLEADTFALEGLSSERIDGGRGFGARGRHSTKNPCVW